MQPILFYLSGQHTVSHNEPHSGQKKSFDQLIKLAGRFNCLLFFFPPKKMFCWEIKKSRQEKDSFGGLNSQCVGWVAARHLSGWLLSKNCDGTIKLSICSEQNRRIYMYKVLLWSDLLHFYQQVDIFCSFFLQNLLVFFKILGYCK